MRGILGQRGSVDGGGVLAVALREQEARCEQEAPGDAVLIASRTRSRMSPILLLVARPLSKATTVLMTPSAITAWSGATGTAIVAASLARFHPIYQCVNVINTD